MKNVITTLILSAVSTGIVIAASTADVSSGVVAAPQVAHPGNGSTGEIRVMGSYEDCTVTYDAKKGEIQGSGTNTITFRSSYGTWTVSYRFGNGNYLMSGAGNLEGKAINVRFDGGRPASLKSSYGSGYCTVTSASKN